MRIVHLYTQPETPKPRKPSKAQEQRARVELMLKEQDYKDDKKFFKEYAPKIREVRERIKRLKQEIKEKSRQFELSANG